MVAKQKARLAHLRRKRKKTKEEEIAFTDKELYEDLFTQDAIMEEVYSFYEYLFQHWPTYPYYDKVIDALWLSAIKKLSEVELQKTYCQITMEESSNCMKDPK